jgi:hypothetical protein
MSRNALPRAALLIRRDRYMAALSRPELRAESTPRVSSAGPVSMPIKVTDAATRALIDEALKKRKR